MSLALALAANIIQMAVVTLFRSFVVQFLAAKIAGFKPRYWRVYFALLASYVSFIIIVIIFSLIYSVLGLTEYGKWFVLLTIIYCFVEPIFMVLFFKGTDREKITYMEALLVSFVHLLLGVVLIVLFHAVIN